MLLTENELKPFIKKIEKGNKLDEKGKHQEAIKIYLDTWDELPEPKLEQPERIANWIMNSIVNCYIDLKDFLNAKIWAEKTLETERAKDLINFYEYFQMGAIYFELNEYDKAMEYFEIVYQRAQKRGFQEFDKKYWKFYSENKK
jgi:hypothetical protein